MLHDIFQKQRNKTEKEKGREREKGKEMGKKERVEIIQV